MQRRKHDNILDESIIKNLILLRPKDYKPIKLFDIEDKKVLVLSYVTKSGKDEFVDYDRLISFFNKRCIISMTAQIYYDVFELGISSISERPKCPVCGSFTKWAGPVLRYRSYCCRAHYDEILRNQKSIDYLRGTKDESQIFEEFLKLAPHPGVPHEDWFVEGQGKKQMRYVRIYSWATIDGLERVVPSSILQFYIDKYFKVKVSIQIYYDVVALGLTNISQRPKCAVCGKPTKFIGILNKGGYLNNCSDNCFEKQRNTRIQQIGFTNGRFKGRKLSPQSLARFRDKMKNQTYSDQYRKSVSIRMKAYYKTSKGKEHIEKSRELTRLRNMRTILDGNPSNNCKSKYVNGIYKSTIFNAKFSYDSSWELNFIKYFERHEKLRKDIVVFDRCTDFIDYYQSDGSFHKYNPDFYIKFKSGLEVVIEIKPKSLLKSPIVHAKRLAAKKYFRKKNIKYIILTEDDLYRSRRISYTKLSESLGILDSFSIWDHII